MMDQKERRALDRCFEAFLRDLDPSPAFLHLLYAEGVLTEEQIDRITKVTSRETQVALLLRFLPHRGPNAFSIFKEKLEKDYGWLAQKLTDELRKLQSGQAGINKRLINVIETQLVPLVYTSGTNPDTCDEKSHPGVIIEKLGDLLTRLENKCLKALDLTVLGSYKAPIHQLIEQRVKTEKKHAVDDDVDDLNKQVKDLKKQLRDAAKLKGENERLKNTVEKQKVKLRDYTKMTRDSKRWKQESDKYKKEIDMLKHEIKALKDQLQSNVSNMFA